eukprot:GHVN01091791.1.p1 GENE.GHVN01091791.1~~GHVN01091791.1.p1  ORF type:complete len:106 (+),score=8.41 GHVN01091791.1:258-575(+)
MLGLTLATALNDRGNPSQLADCLIDIVASPWPSNMSLTGMSDVPLILIGQQTGQFFEVTPFAFMCETQFSCLQPWMILFISFLGVEVKFLFFLSQIFSFLHIETV